MKPVSLLLYTGFIVFLYMGIYALRLDYRARQNIVFFLLCISLAWWSFTFSLLFYAPLEDAEKAWFWFKLSYPGWMVAASIILHFCLTITGKEESLGKWFFPVVYLPGFIFLGAAYMGQLTDIAYSPLYGWGGGGSSHNLPVFLFFVMYYMGYMIWGNVIVARWGKNSALQKEKMQARMIVSCSVISITLIFLVGTLLPNLGIHIIPRVPSLMALVWVYGMWHAITKYRLMVFTPAIAAEEIIENIRDLLILVDPRGNIISINRHSERILGYKQEELAGRPVSVIIPDLPELADDMEKMLKKEIIHYKRAISYKTSNNKDVPVRLYATAIQDSMGDIAGFIFVAQDLRETKLLKKEIDERERIQEELIRSNIKLKEMDRIKTEFLSTVSHELKTPLTSIFGFTKIIKKRFEDIIEPCLDITGKKAARASRQMKDNMNIVIGEGERLTALINDVLDLTKMEAGKTAFREEDLYMEEVIERAVHVSSSLIEEKELKLLMDIQPNLPPVTGDQDRLIQVMLNIISNAVKFTEEGTITCRAVLSENDELKVSVTDTGIGINKENLEAVFDKFRQLGDLMIDKPTGTGLGLSICKEIIERHGGRIWAESVPGAGSTFSFTIPVKQEDRGFF